MKLDKKERLKFSYLLKILEKLYPEEQEYYANHRKAIENGYELHYNWLTEHLYDGMTKDECQEVLDILEMSRGILYSFMKLDNPTKITKADVKFKGFDGNNEISQMLYAEYFIEDLGRYEEIKESCGGYYNSHYPSLDSYRTKLEKWKKMPSKDKFNMDENTLLDLINT